MAWSVVNKTRLPYHKIAATDNCAPKLDTEIYLVIFLANPNKIFLSNFLNIQEGLMGSSMSYPLLVFGVFLPRPLTLSNFRSPVQPGFLPSGKILCSYSAAQSQPGA